MASSPVQILGRTLLPPFSQVAQCLRHRSATDHSRPSKQGARPGPPASSPAGAPPNTRQNAIRFAYSVCRDRVLRKPRADGRGRCPLGPQHLGDVPGVVPGGGAAFSMVWAAAPSRRDVHRAERAPGPFAALLPGLCAPRGGGGARRDRFHAGPREWGPASRRLVGGRRPGRERERPGGRGSRAAHWSRACGRTVVRARPSSRRAHGAATWRRHR